MIVETKKGDSFMAKKFDLKNSSPVLYIVLGALLTVFGHKMLGIAMTVAGIVFVVLGIIDILGARMTSGVTNIVIGAVILVLGNLVLDIVLLVLGIIIAAKGVMALVEVLKNQNKNITEIIYPAITIIVGVGLACGNLLGDLIVVVGILLIVDGVLGLLGLKKK